MQVMKICVMGAGGFIGHHLTSKLNELGHNVVGVDLKKPMFEESKANEFIVGDLRDLSVVEKAISGCEQIFQLAADMGGAGYIFTGENDIAIMHNSAQININLVAAAQKSQTIQKILYTSSACIYPDHIQTNPDSLALREEDAYPAAPDSEYGWEKLFSERLYQTLKRNCQIDTRIVRLHNIFGPLGTWMGGREKAPAALCRKVAESSGEIEVWGSGKQTRSFLYIDECIEGLLRINSSSYDQPINLGSDERISVADLARMIIFISGKDVKIKFIDGPIGVEGRSSDNTQILDVLAWAPSEPLVNGIKKTYSWIQSQLNSNTITTSLVYSELEAS